MEFRRHHADNFVGCLTHHHAPANNVARSAEGLLPQVMADNRRLAAGRLVIRPEAAQRGSNAEQRQEVRRHFVQFDLRRLARRLDETGTIPKCREIREAFGLAAPVLPVRIRCRRLRASQPRVQIPDDGQFSGIAIGQRLPGHVLQHAEKGCGGADPDGE